jgi:hypothetical protein
MDAISRVTLWEQLGGAIDMLENAIHACPDDLWTRQTPEPQYWYLAFHTLFFLDLYLSDATGGFAPPAPFTLSEIDPDGVLPDGGYTKAELLAYLGHGRTKARARVAALTPENAHKSCEYGWITLTVFEALLYNLRHVQHHTAQLNLLLRQAHHDAPRWVSRARLPLTNE